MYDNMTEFVATTMREDAAAWAAKRARAATREGQAGQQRQPAWRMVVAKALLAVANAMAPTGKQHTQTA